jgi:Protein of unknown function (DUF1236)
LRRLLVSALLLALPLAAAGAQSPADTAGRNLSLEQQTKIADVITREAPSPIREARFTLAIGNAVPADVALRPVPASAEQIAPQFHGASYVVVEEQIAILDTQTRKILAVVQRGLSQAGSTPAPRR